MPPVTRRAPAPAARPPARPAPRAATTGSSGYRGAEGLRKMEEEQERAELRREASAAMSHAPFRFYVPPGETREIIVIDEAPDFFRHEHNIKGPDGKWSIFAPCIAEHANCPICQSGPEKPAYFAMYLTIIDLTPYVSRKDNREVEWSKKLLCIKPSMQKKFMRLFERHGTLRGMHLSMTRDGDKEAAIGNDVEFIQLVDEDTLAAYVSSYEDSQKKLVEVIGNEPFDYDAIFPPQTEEALAALVGGTVNNYASASRAAGRRGDEGSGDGWDDKPANAARAPARPAARPAAPARPSAPLRPAARHVPRDEEAVDEDAPVEEYEEEAAPPPRRAVPSGASRVAPREAPQRAAAPAVNPVARRAQLRGGR